MQINVDGMAVPLLGLPGCNSNEVWWQTELETLRESVCSKKENQMDQGKECYVKRSQQS
jgi:hypothetical protein